MCVLNFSCKFFLLLSKFFSLLICLKKVVYSVIICICIYIYIISMQSVSFSKFCEYKIVTELINQHINLQLILTFVFFLTFVFQIYVK